MQPRILTVVRREVARALTAPAAAACALASAGLASCLWMRRCGQAGCSAPCGRLRATPQAKVLGVPNELLGALYYAAWLWVCLTPHGWTGPVGLAVRTASHLALALSLYLAVQLVAVLRVRCGSCFLAHAVNLGLWVVAMAAGDGR